MNHSTPHVSRILRALLWLGCVGRLTAACGDGDVEYTDKVFGPTAARDASYARETDTNRDAGNPDSGPSQPCMPAEASDQVPAREAVITDDISGEASTDQGVFTKALFDEFIQHCGSCHSGTVAQGGLSANFGTFAQNIDAEALARIRSDTPGVGGFMPPAPAGVPFSRRSPSDPVRQFAERLEQWIDQGRPAEVFYPKQSGGSSTKAAGTGYLLRKSVGMQLTNLGNCIPAPYLMAAEQAAMAELDAKFAAMKQFEDLPKSLSETDLFTLDAEELAGHGVIAFAPAYTLWADNAKKIRMVRVPRGESIRFDPETQSFDIPANTRFYKTFLKDTIDLNGQKRYRKLETRIIVARPAQLKPDGTYEQTALFGTYRWNEAETEATLVARPYRDGKGFRDEVFPVVVDERIDDEVLRKGPKNLLAARIEAGAMRNYAIPGFDRCMHCHMGSPMQNFVLGFIPLQIHRRPMGEGGVVEAAARDELNQVQRLIDYGVITGLGSADEIGPLEASQGARKPRNEHELNAQGYMLGNCAHCHNPNGFPSLKEPVLKEALDLLPSQRGGIFQFPLDKFSPRTFRGDKQNIKIPYITPSLYDLSPTDLGLGSFKAVGSFPKWIDDDSYLLSNAGEQGSLWDKWWADRLLRENNIYQPGRALLAPWRSLIYRNVDAPFAYEETGTIFPHMPMDTPGYDCRARRLLGTWMVSIPARLDVANLKIIGNDSSNNRVERDFSPGTTDEFFFVPEPQPYVEVAPDDPIFSKAQIQASARVSTFRSSPRFNDCPSDKLDILDPVVAAAGTGLPAPQVATGVDLGGGAKGNYFLASPARPHYFETDLRQDTSWIIRRGDWYQVLVPSADDDNDPYNNDPYLGDDTREWRRVYDALQTVSLTDNLRKLALTEVPFGLWVDKPECSAKFEAARVGRAGDLQGDARPSWMALKPDLKAEAPVYSISPGAQVFDMICAKCHGPNGDGQSSLASTMADLTGGLTRVANLRDGIFGPPGQPGANRADPLLGFGQPGLGALPDGTPLTPDDWAARYTVWMGLGGTRANLPKSAVAAIGASEVLGTRSGIQVVLEGLDTQKAANMLEIAKLSCQALVPNRPDPEVRDQDRDIIFDPIRGALSEDPARDGSDDGDKIRNYKSLAATNGGPGEQKYYSLGKTGLIVTNGHADLWQRLCTLDNPLPVRMVSFETTGQTDFLYVSGLYRRAHYPAGAEVGEGGRKVAGLSPSNISPWCVIPPSPQSGAGRVSIERFPDYLQRTGLQLPMCPAEILADDAPGRILFPKALPDGTVITGDDDVERWAIRGAMNAGMSVFVYLDAISRGLIQPKPAYNRCQDLKP